MMMTMMTLMAKAVGRLISRLSGARWSNRKIPRVTYSNFITIFFKPISIKNFEIFQVLQTALLINQSEKERAPFSVWIDDDSKCFV